MAKVTIAVSVLLMVLGVGCYFLTEESNMVELLPAYFGLPLFAFGLVARNEYTRRHALLATVIFGLLGFFVALMMGFPQWKMVASGAEIPRPLLAYEQLAMTILCGGSVVLCVKSLIAARKARV